ncbi:unnamed protein product [Rotaria sordida]|uniref:Daxx histone-binding domain-containing protein n=1 Tax=Rotaria sordida TaxID=392033 RepID=A0A813NC25_9BILA|nr:unnamed protein product [Rotaria sordida]
MTDDIFDNIKIQFEQFLSLVGNVLAHEKEINIIQNKLRRHFNITSSCYLCSTDFQSLLKNIHTVFTKNDKSTKYFTLLASFDEQLKRHNVKLLRSHRSSKEPSNPTRSIESVKPISSTNEKIGIISSKSSTTTSFTSSLSTNNESSISTSAVEQTIEQLHNSCNNVALELNESQLPTTSQELKITTDPMSTSEYKIARKKKINKLERRLRSLSKTIRELEGKDMSLDEMKHCDLYAVESNLKKRTYEIYIKLTELKSQSSSTERILDQPVTLTGSEIDHPLINKALEDMVNRTKYLPSFNDVLNTVEKTNDKYKLNLSADFRKNFAEKSFKIIGKKIKNRRMADFNDIMNSRLPEDFNIEQNDPALINVEIEKALLENEREAIIKTEKILDEFSQIDPNLEPEVTIESSEESNIENDEEEKCEEEEGVESAPEVIVALSENKPDEMQYDIVDILPPFSSESSSPAEPVVTETINNEDPVEATVEISLNDRTLTILSTASIPLTRAARDSFASIIQKSESEPYITLDENDIQESQSIAFIQEHKVQTIIPRRRQHIATDETLNNRYKTRLTNNDSSVSQKRISPKDVESSKSKNPKIHSEIVIVD